MGCPAKALTAVRWSVGSNPTFSATVMSRDVPNSPDPLGSDCFRFLVHSNNWGRVHFVSRLHGCVGRCSELRAKRTRPHVSCRSVREVTPLSFDCGMMTLMLRFDDEPTRPVGSGVFHRLPISCVTTSRTRSPTTIAMTPPTSPSSSGFVTRLDLRRSTCRHPSHPPRHHGPDRGHRFDPGDPRWLRCVPPSHRRATQRNRTDRSHPFPRDRPPVVHLDRSAIEVRAAPSRGDDRSARCRVVR